jgi:hypothetical protein
MAAAAAMALRAFCMQIPFLDVLQDQDDDHYDDEHGQRRGLILRRDTPFLLAAESYVDVRVVAGI